MSTTYARLGTAIGGMVLVGLVAVLGYFVIDGFFGDDGSEEPVTLELAEMLSAEAGANVETVLDALGYGCNESLDAPVIHRCYFTGP